MTESRVRAYVTGLMLGGNCIVFLCLTALWIVGGFSTNEYKQAMLLLTPLLFAYASPILKHVFDRRAPDAQASPQVTPAAFILSVAAPPLVMALTVLLSILKAFNFGLTSFDDYTVAVGAVQTVFGTYIGLVMSTFFQSKGADSATA